MKNVKLAVLILTKDEELHIERCVNSLRGVAEDIFVVDSGSSDNTIKLAKDLGCSVKINGWKNYASQFNWGLRLIHELSSCQWVLRIDADEFLTESLAAEIKHFLRDTSSYIGASCGRQMAFQKHLIQYGGMFPVQTVRLMRLGAGFCEDKWMDEHLVVDGAVFPLKGVLIDDNLKPLSWWVEKHNSYASREAVDLLNLKYNFLPSAVPKSYALNKTANRVRFCKERIYARLPLGWRAAFYFFYRYFIRLGLLDGPKGFYFHFLQGFWYRLLVDLKISEVESVISTSDPSEIRDAVKQKLMIDL